MIAPTSTPTRAGGRVINPHNPAGRNNGDSVPTKYIFITGGVLSSLGKGLAAASIGTLLESRGLSVTFQKLDPYINVDPGTMNPFQHGEVFVTDDGAETDLDLGHYERYTTTAKLGKHSNYTTGKIYHQRHHQRAPGAISGRHGPDHPPRDRRDQKGGALRGERTERPGHHRDRRHGGRYRGSLPFLEAIRQFRADVGQGQRALHPPHPGALHQDRRRAQDQTHPALGQRAALHRHPARHPALPHRGGPGQVLKDKIALFCNVEPRRFITAVDVEYHL